MTYDIFNQPKKPYNPSYFNTTNITGDELKQKKERVIGQNGEILQIFASNPTVMFSPWDVYDRMRGKYPITSVRRGMTTLEQRGYLVKTDFKKKSGPYNETNYTWQLHPNQLK